MDSFILEIKLVNDIHENKKLVSELFDINIENSSKIVFDLIMLFLEKTKSDSFHKTCWEDAGLSTIRRYLVENGKIFLHFDKKTQKLRIKDELFINDLINEDVKSISYKEFLYLIKSSEKIKSNKKIKICS